MCVLLFATRPAFLFSFHPQSALWLFHPDELQFFLPHIAQSISAVPCFVLRSMTSSIFSPCADCKHRRKQTLHTNFWFRPRRFLVSDRNPLFLCFDLPWYGLHHFLNFGLFYLSFDTFCTAFMCYCEIWVPLPHEYKTNHSPVLKKRKKIQKQYDLHHWSLLLHRFWGLKRLWVESMQRQFSTNLCLCFFKLFYCSFCVSSICTWFNFAAKLNHCKAWYPPDFARRPLWRQYPKYFSSARSKYNDLLHCKRFLPLFHDSWQTLFWYAGFANIVAQI